MRRFLFLAHNAPSDGAWSLDDLPSTGGRVDVLCRNIQSAFHISHSIRPDVEVYCLFQHPTPRVVRLQGAAIRRLNPDERSTAARLQQALASPGAGPDWKEVQDGLAVAQLALEDLLDELPGPIVLLDPEGEPLEEAQLPASATFVLSDHVPFTDAEYTEIDRRDAQRISLGTTWYHGNHVVAVLQYALDRAHGTPSIR